METLNLDQAAQFLHMSSSALRAKAKHGEIKGAKAGKRWVFLRSDLVDYLRSKQPVVATNDLRILEVPKCQSIREAKSFGSESLRQVGKEYASLLAQ